MGAFGWFQLLVDVAFCFLIMLLLVGRSWRRGGAGSADQEAYREMISTLSALIREMKDGAAEMDKRLEARRAEMEETLAVADARVRQIEAALVKAGPAASEPVPAGSATPRTPQAAAGAAAAPAARRPGADPAPSAAPSSSRRRADSEPVADMDDDERREKYRQALDFARKGWDAAEIARHTKLPRGEVELLIRTKGAGA